MKHLALVHRLFLNPFQPLILTISELSRSKRLNSCLYMQNKGVSEISIFIYGMVSASGGGHGFE